MSSDKKTLESAGAFEETDATAEKTELELARARFLIDIAKEFLGKEQNKPDKR